MPRLIVGLVVLLLSACSGLGLASGGSGEVEVQTDPAELCWSGAFGDRTVEGCGSRTVELESMSGVFVANAQKQSEGGMLTLILSVDGREVDRTSTTAAYGVASVDSG